MDRKALARLKAAYKGEEFNILYVIVGRVDGRWEIQAFDSKYKAIGVTISVATPDQAWKIWMMLNGYSFEAVSDIETKASA